jgi:hypothetical protein
MVLVHGKEEKEKEEGKKSWKSSNASSPEHVITESISPIPSQG